MLEHVFAPDAALPDPADLPGLTETHLAQGIARHAPFLAAAEWQLERETLRREALRAAQVWHGILGETGARILKNEFRLEGNAHGIDIRGRADCILHLGDGRLVIVDHKKSGSTRRRMRMRAGWDLQIGLYRAMLARPIRAEGDGLDLVAGQKGWLASEGYPVPTCTSKCRSTSPIPMARKTSPSRTTWRAACGLRHRCPTSAPTSLSARC